MAKIVLLLTILFILATISESINLSHQKRSGNKKQSKPRPQAQPKEKKPKGDYSQESKRHSLYKGVIGLSWLGGFCTKKQQEAKNNKSNPTCSQRLYKLWDRQSFTIHGLWPAVNTSVNYQPFNIENINTQLVDEMENFWPPQYTFQKERYGLWEHEYSTHGKDFNQLIKRLNPKQYSKASDKTLQSKYFSSAIGFYQRLKLNKLRQSLVDLYLSPSQKVVLRKSDLSKILKNLPQDNFFVQCLSKDGQQYLWQIKICFEVYQQQERLQINPSSCPSYGPINKNTCKDASFTLIDFDWNNLQQRVTNELVTAKSKQSRNLQRNNSQDDN